MTTLQTAIRTRVLAGFTDPTFGSGAWDALLARGSTPTVNLTWLWQRAWWETFGRGELLLIAAERDGEVTALAPLFAQDGMVFNLCPEDYLDFLGDIGDPGVLDALLRAAIEQVPGFLGFRFYFVPDASATGQRLMEAARRLGLACFEEDSLPVPALDLAGQPEAALAATRKKSLLRHERFFEREGGFEVRHLRDGADVLPHLDDFFAQHVARRAATPHPSLFEEPRQREYYRRVTREAGSAGWLRFTRVDWQGRPIAFHWGLSYRGRYLWGIPSFAVDLAHRSPGEVLLRHVLLDAIGEGARSFDFGPGDEAYKYRFATEVPCARNWGLYPAGAVGGIG